MFRYVEALAVVGVRSVIVAPTLAVARPRREIHRPTGAAVWFLPSPSPHRRLAARALGERLGARRDPRSLAAAAAGHLLPYTATPPVRLARLLRAERCDAVLCQEYETPRFDVAVAVGAALRIPVSATFQGGDYQLSRLERHIRPTSIRRAKALIVAATGEAERVWRTYGVPQARVARIFNPIDTGTWRPGDRAAARSRLGIDPHASVVAWHGQVELWRKGLDVLFAAWKRLYEARPERTLLLLVVGRGQDLERTRAEVAARRLAGVWFIDEWFHDPARLREFLLAADVYAFPSRHEGFPVAPIEALACGLPVVAADAHGVRDILRSADDGGLVVPREDPVALANAIGELLDDDHRRVALATRARRRAEDAFGLEAVGTQLARVLLRGSAASAQATIEAGRPGE